MLVSRRPVYCGDQTRSFHGTTLQLVQPDPNLLCITDEREKGLGTRLVSLRTAFRCSGMQFIRPQIAYLLSIDGQDFIAQ